MLIYVVAIQRSLRKTPSCVMDVKKNTTARGKKAYGLMFFADIQQSWRCKCLILLITVLRAYLRMKL